jgi:hypothetical protein
MGNSDVHLVPLLGSGRHFHPHEGGCLLELVGTLPGGRWTDHPDAVGPVLGALVRAVNDRTSPVERPALAPLIPYLAELPPTGHRPDTDAPVAITAVAAAAPTAGHGVAERLSRIVAAARSDDAARPGPRGWSARRTRHRAAVHAVGLAVDSLAITQGDEALRILLVEAFNQVRVLHRQPAVPPLTRAAADCRGAVPVRSELRIPGGDSTYLYCSALLDAWPAWLRAP